MNVLWNRLRYVLSPQFDIYETVSRIVRRSVADIGFGTGFGTHLLLNGAKTVSGFEIDNEAIQFAQRVFPFETMRFEQGDISRGISGKFDYVTMIDVIEHLEDDEGAIRNAAGMLLPGGTLICSTPNRLSRYRKAETHYREYSPDELATLLRGVFPYVGIKNYRMEPLSSPYENPILAFCQNGN